MRRPDPLLQDPRPWLLVPVQVKVRELTAKVLLAAVAAERGYGTVLGTHRRLRPLLHFAFPPSVVVDYSAAYPFVPLFERYHRAGHSVTACEEEGLVEVPSDAFPCVDLYFAWGEAEAGRLVATHGDRGRIAVTGHPRFDLLRPELRVLHRDAVDGLRAAHGRYLLVNTNFAANVQFGVSVLQQTYQFDTEGFSEEDATWFRERDVLSRKMFEAFQTMVAEVATAFPDHTIVLRPHPSENVEAWQELLRGIPNVVVELAGPVVPWILGADAVIHNSCTTGIESRLLDVPVVSFRPFRAEAYEWDLPNQVSDQVTSVPDLVEALRAIVADADRGAPPTLPDIGPLLPHVWALDGPLAAERMVDGFDQVAKPAVPLAASPLWQARARAAFGVITLKHLVNLALRRTRIPLSFERLKNPGWDAAEVEHILVGLHRATGRFDDVHVVDLTTDVVAIGTR